MRVTVLMENTSPEGLLHEHGLSLHIAYQGRSILLDGGSSGRFVRNAAALGVDLRRVDAAVLSHGHYDHADGLSAFCEANAAAKIHARPAVREPDYVQVGPVKKFIGVSPALLARFGDRFELADGPRELFPGLHLVPDAAHGEQSLVAETAGGLVVMNSCCHAGPGPIVRDILARFPGQAVRALVGGFHLMGLMGAKTLGAAPGDVKALARLLTDELGVSEIYTGHCTGAPAFQLLSDERPDQIHPLRTGDVLEF